MTLNGTNFHYRIDNESGSDTIVLINGLAS